MDELVQMVKSLTTELASVKGTMAGVDGKVNVKDGRITALQ